MTINFYRAIQLSDGNGNHGKAAPGFVAKFGSHYVFVTLRGFYHSKA